MLSLASAGCAIAALHPATPHPLPLPRSDAAPLPLTVAVHTLMGGGNRPCEHLARPLIERLEEQRLFQNIRTSPAADVQLRLTFDCSYDDHYTWTIYSYMLVGGTLFLASPLPLFDIDYTLKGTAEVIHDGRLVRGYHVTTHVDGDYNYWALLRAGYDAALIQRGEDDLVAKLVAAIVADRTFWEQLTLR